MSSKRMDEIIVVIVTSVAAYLIVIATFGLFFRTAFSVYFTNALPYMFIFIALCLIAHALITLPRSQDRLVEALADIKDSMYKSRLSHPTQEGPTRKVKKIKDQTSME